MRVGVCVCQMRVWCMAAVMASLTTSGLTQHRNCRTKYSPLKISWRGEGMAICGSSSNKSIVERILLTEWCSNPVSCLKMELDSGSFHCKSCIPIIIFPLFSMQHSQINNKYLYDQFIWMVKYPFRFNTLQNNKSIQICAQYMVGLNVFLEAANYIRLFLTTTKLKESIWIHILFQIWKHLLWLYCHPQLNTYQRCHVTSKEI